MISLPDDEVAWASAGYGGAIGGTLGSNFKVVSEPERATCFFIMFNTRAISSAGDGGRSIFGVKPIARLSEIVRVLLIGGRCGRSSPRKNHIREIEIG